VKILEEFIITAYWQLSYIPKVKDKTHQTTRDFKIPGSLLSVGCVLRVSDMTLKHILSFRKWSQEKM